MPCPSHLAERSDDSLNTQGWIGDQPALGHLWLLPGWDNQGHSFLASLSSAVLIWFRPLWPPYLWAIEWGFWWTFSSDEVQEVMQKWLHMSLTIFSWIIHESVTYWSTCTERNGGYVQKWQGCAEPICVKLADNIILRFSFHSPMYM
jgi:hypothetical protein